jgi:hypothetical protein
MFLSRNLRKSSEWVGGQRLLAHAWAALDALVGARRTEQAAQSVWADWADQAGGSLAWAADWALGGIALEHAAHVSHALDVVHAHAWHAGGVLAACGAGILALLARQLGADGAGDVHVTVHILDGDGRALGVLVVLGLGRVLQTLVRLDDVLALRRLVDDATLHVRECRGLGGAGWDLATLAGDTSAVGALHWAVHFVLFV